MLDYTKYLKIFIALLAVVDPFAAMLIVITMIARDENANLKLISRTVVITVTIVLLVALYLGQRVLDFFGISINSFRVSGGILLMMMSLAMLKSKVSETVCNHEEAEEEDQQTAVVPLAIPVLASPSAMSAVSVRSS
jgi:multiple antibiotic resistance protein